MGSHFCEKSKSAILICDTEIKEKKKPPAVPNIGSFLLFHKSFLLKVNSRGSREKRENRSVDYKLKKKNLAKQN